MAKPVSPATNPTFRSSSFSDSEIAVAIQLIHLSDKSVSSTAGFEDDGSHTSRHRATATTLVEEIFGVGSNRRRRKPRSRSVYEIYKSTEPIISGGGGGGIAKRKWNMYTDLSNFLCSLISFPESKNLTACKVIINRLLRFVIVCLKIYRRNRSRRHESEPAVASELRDLRIDEAEMERNRSRPHESEAAVASGLRDLQIDEDCNLRRKNREAEMEFARNRSRRHESEAAVASGLGDLQIDEACNLRRKNREAEMEYVYLPEMIYRSRNRSRRHESEA